MGCGSSFTVLPSIINKKSKSNTSKDNSNPLPPIKSQEKPVKKLLEQKQKRFDNFEPLTLICLDDHIDENNQQFRSVIDYFCCFNDFEQCEEFILKTNKKSEHLFFIVSNQYATNIVSHIHDLKQIIAIYILQENTRKDFIDEKWTKRYSKVKGIYLNQDALLEELTADVKMYEDIGDLLPITVYSRSDNIQTTNSSKDNLRFLFYQLFIHEYCLNSSSSLNKRNFIEIIEDYYSTNSDQLDEINQFDDEYHSTKKMVLKCFLHYSFIRRLLTKSLLTLNLKILFSLRFFIKDIYKIMTDIHSSSKNAYLSNEQIYYRSQILSEETFERIKSNIGELLSINNFLLANKNRHDSLIYLRQSHSSTKSIYRILFEMKIPSDYIYNKQRPFIDITHYTTDNYTILFFIGSIFRINKVVFDINNDCWTIALTLYDEQTNNDFSQIFTYFNKNPNPILLANLLRQISPDSAEHFYKHLLKENPSEEKVSKVECYHGLGHCSYLGQDYEQALIYFEKALEMKPNDKYLQSSLHNSIGLVYAQQDDIEQAYKHFSEALKYTSLPLHKASVHHNLALISGKQGLYDQELEHYQQAFDIRTDQLPANHLQVASLLNNIGIAYSDMNEYDQGLSNLKKALEMRLKLLSANHIDVAKSYANIGTVYAKTEEFNMALEYFNKAKLLFEKQQTIPEQDIKIIDKNIKYVNDKLRRKTY